MSSVTYAGNEYSEDQFKTAANALAENKDVRITQREQFIQELGRQYQGDRDIYDVLGYSKEIEPEQYRAKFERQDIARRIVELPAKDTWKKSPEVSDNIDAQSDSEFDTKLQQLEKRIRIWNTLYRADVASGIGEYGLIFLGLADGQDLDVEVGSVSGPEDLSYITPFSQDQVIEWDLGKDTGLDPSHERYNKPVEYTISFADPDEDIYDEAHWEDVHWERVVHVAEDRIGSELKGTPRLRPIFNRLEDLEKVLGSSAEMFWSGADEKYHFNIDTEDTQRISSDALDDLDEEVQNLVHDMEKAVKTFNTDLEVIGGQEVNPEGVITELMKFISGATGIPKRMLTGSERGELASTQDRANWFKEVESRQHRFAGPEIVRPTMERLQVFGILPQAEIEIEWPNLFNLTELEKTEVQRNRAEAASTLTKAKVFASAEDLFEWMEEGETPDFEESEPMQSVPQPVEQAQFQRGQQMQEEESGSDVSEEESEPPQESQEGDETQSSNAFSDLSEPLSRQEALGMLEESGLVSFNVQLGSRVSTPDGIGVVAEKVDDVGEDESLSGTDLDPSEQTVYVVALKSGGHDFYSSDDLESTSFDVDVDADSDEIQSANSMSTMKSILPFVTNDWSMPDSWQESSKPSRLILLDAWASMGGQFNCGGSCCMGDLHDEQLCAAMKDEVLGTTEWRGGWAD